MSEVGRAFFNATSFIHNHILIFLDRRLRINQFALLFFVVRHGDNRSSVFVQTLLDARQFFHDRWINYVELLEAIDSHKFVSVDRVLLLSVREHLRDHLEGEILLVCHNRATLLVFVVTYVVLIGFLQLLEVSWHLGFEVG